MQSFLPTTLPTDLIRNIVPRFGTLLIESMIGGRPIATVRLLEPLQHQGFAVQCLEIPSPKEGSHYSAGLEHAELVIGSPADGVTGNTRLRQWVEELPAALRQRLDMRAIGKEINADVSLSLPAWRGLPMAGVSHRRCHPLSPLTACAAAQSSFTSGRCTRSASSRSRTVRASACRAIISRQGFRRSRPLRKARCRMRET